jgi:hypothetical protein
MGALTDLQRAAAAILVQDEQLSAPGIVVVCVDKASALAEVIAAMAGAGILIAVGPPAAPTPPCAYAKPRVSTRDRLKGVL